MEKLLYIDSCIRREESRSRQAADYLMKKMEASGKYEIETLCLMDEPLHYLSGDFFRQRERLLAEGRRDHRRFDYAHQFARADVIVIAAPFWDLGFPALLKTYIENISVDGITFYADIEGCHGMSQGRQLIFVTTRGGIMKIHPWKWAPFTWKPSQYFSALINTDASSLKVSISKAMIRKS